MSICKLMHAQEMSLTLGLFQISKFDVVPTPASKVMLQCKYGIYEVLKAPGYLLSSDARVETQCLCGTAVHNRNTACFLSSRTQLRQLRVFVTATGDVSF